MESGLTKENYLRLQSIVDEIFSTSGEECDRLIELRCGNDPNLLNRVRPLLSARDAEEKLSSWLREEQLLASASLAGKWVGPYQIDRLLGRDGVGAAYLAHRADGQSSQKVTIRLIDRPAAPDLFRERFRHGRQLLVGLRHPYIVRLLDGGISADGDLYLVMEYVDGVPIHRFCKEHKLSRTARIEVFLRVCEAVQFAHQNNVLHRDLKPDNILVTEGGTPRLLSFGTAELISAESVDAGTRLTQEGYLTFSPLFASPEQVLGNPITPASDTYSLGVLLYILLTEARPYELRDASTAEMLRMVCEAAPRKPVPPSGSGGRFDRDLEAILLKALRKEPHLRYLTAKDLSDDLRSFLDGRPVAARHDNLVYTTRKFVRRYRWCVLGGILSLIALLAGAGWVLCHMKSAN